MKIIKIVLSLLVITVICPPLSARAIPPSWQEQIRLLAGSEASIWVENSQGKPLYYLQPTAPMVPASTTKLVTSATALERLGPDYRFPTQVYWNPSLKRLTIKGTGNPIFFTEDMIDIVEQLAKHHISAVQELILDNTYFDRHIVIPNHSASDNPSDQYSGALGVDFNVACIRMGKNRKIESVNPLTPLTPSVQKAAARFKKPGTYQIPFTRSESTVLGYFAELLSAIGHERNIVIPSSYRVAPVSDQDTELTTLLSRQPLTEILASLLKFSTNSSANQVFLHVGAHTFGAPATLEKGQRAVTHFLTNTINAKEFHIVEGSGLARENRISAADLTKVVRNIENHHKEIIPTKHGFQAKTGSIREVASLAGFIESPTQGTLRFAIILNGQKGYPNKGMENRYKIAEVIKENI